MSGDKRMSEDKKMSGGKFAVVIYGYRLKCEYSISADSYIWYIMSDRGGKGNTRHKVVITTSNSVRLDHTKKVEGLTVANCGTETLIGDVVRQVGHVTPAAIIDGIDSHFSDDVNNFYRKYALAPSVYVALCGD